MSLADYRPPKDELIIDEMQVHRPLEERNMMYKCTLENFGFESRGCDMIKVINNEEIVFTRLVRRGDGNHLYLRVREMTDKEKQMRMD